MVRLFFFTSLSVVACALALANIATAAAPSGQDQYLEQTPNGGGTSDPGGRTYADAVGGGGSVTEADVIAQATQNQRKAKQDGAEDGAADAASTTPTPPSAQSVATAAKFGPFSRGTALLLGGLVLLGGIGIAAVKGGAFAGGPGGDGGAGSGPPGPPTGN